MSAKKLLYLSKRDLEDIALPMNEIVAALEQVFREKGRGEVEMPPKPGIHPQEDSSIRAMLAYIPSLKTAGVKWISGYGRNYIAGLPNINGLIILNDPKTGVPKAIMDCTWITAMRTGAATAVAAKYLAKKDSKTLGIIACGRLGRTNVRALLNTFKLERVYAYDIDFQRAKIFAKEVQEWCPAEVIPVRTVKRAVEELDIVVTSGPIVDKPEPPIKAAWLKPGSFGCALDFDASFEPKAFSQAQLLVTDDIPQFEYFRGTGYFKQTPEPHLDLGKLVAEPKRRRRNPATRTMSIQLGIGILDIAVGKLVYDRALEMDDIGTELPF